MSEKRFSLDVIGVAEPCHEDWSDMTGGEQKKFCNSCAKHVHNLSEMTRDEAERFVSDNPVGVCIRFRRDANTGKMLTADPRNMELAAATATVPRAPGGGRFSGRLPSRHGRRPRPQHPRAAPRRAAHRMAGSVFVPVLSVFSLIAGLVAVLVNGGRAPVAQPPTVMGGISCPPHMQQPKYAASGVGVAPVPLPPAGFLAQTVKAPPVVEPPVLMGRIAAPVEPPIMGLICPPEPEPIPEPKPVPPEVMGEIEFIMGDIACPEEPLRAVDPIPAPLQDPSPPGDATQN